MQLALLVCQSASVTVKRDVNQSYNVGVKSYPRGVTTNSDGGIESYETYYPVFKAMQDVDMVLNLHGEVPSNADSVISSHFHWGRSFIAYTEYPCPQC